MNLYIPKKNSHKGQNGRVLVIGGSKDYFGAPMLACKSAFRLVDVVYLYTPPVVFNKIMDVHIIPIRGKKENYLCSQDVDVVLQYADNVDCVLIGNGLGVNEDTRFFVNEFMKGYGGRVVVDADAIKVMEWDNILKKSIILTPNQNEYEKYVRAVEDSLLNSGAVICLKGAVDKIISKDKIMEVKGGNAGLTKAGTGDVLAGIIAGLYAKNDAFLSAYYGCKLIKDVADKLYESKGYWYVPEEIVEMIGEVIKDRVINYNI